MLVRKKINSWMDKCKNSPGEIDTKWISFIKPDPCPHEVYAVGKMYGLVKDHKNENPKPMRLITSSCNTVWNNSDVFVATKSKTNCSKN